MRTRLNPRKSDTVVSTDCAFAYGVQQVFCRHWRHLEETIKNVGQMRQNKDKKELKLKLSKPDEIDEQIRLRLSWLMIKEMEFEHKLRSRAIRLSQKRKKQADSWVI